VLATVRSREPWICFNANFGDPGEIADHWATLVHTAPWVGAAGVVLDPGTGNLQVRSEILLTGQADLLRERIGWACSAIAHASSRRPNGPKRPDGRPEGPETTRPTEGGSGAPVPAEELLDSSLKDRGWDVVRREDEFISVGLKDPGGARCLIIPGSESGFRAEAEFYVGPHRNSLQRWAQGHFLLVGAGTFRAVFAFGTSDDKTDRAGLGVCLPARASAPELDHALSALSLAVARLRPSSQALEDPSVAERYAGLHSRVGPGHGEGIHRREERSSTTTTHVHRKTRKASAGRPFRNRREGNRSAETLSQGGD
jgi:hypothetical protein